MKLLQARNYALSLQETTEEPHFQYSSFRVRGKIFATFPEAGDHMHIFVDDSQRAPLIAAQPDTFETLYWGTKVVGVKVLLEHANANTVKRLLLQSWARKAPRQLVAALNVAK